MPVITLNKSQELYLQRCITEWNYDGVIFGIIIGQNINTDDYIVVHLAKNQEEDIINGPMEPSKDSMADHTPRIVLNFANINTHFLANQWLSAIRMLPGSFSVLGIFVGADDENILGNSTFELTGRLLNEIHDILIQTKNFAIDEVEHDYVFLAYSLDASKAVCKVYSQDDYQSTFKPIDCQFTSEPFQWYTFSCHCKLNEIFPIYELTKEIDIKQQFKATIEMIRQTIEESKILIQHQYVNEESTIEAYIKNSLANNNLKVKYRIQEYHASILLPTDLHGANKTNSIRVRLFGGTVRFLGGISSVIYCRPQNTIKDVKQYIRCDLNRSLIARIQIYCDDWAETKTTAHHILISRPPRRVYFYLSKNDQDCPIKFSEYVYRNETTGTAVTQAHHVLDLDLKMEDIIDDFEAMNMDEVYSDTKSHDQPLTLSESNLAQSISHSMYMLGVVLSLLVLLLSVCLSYFLVN